MLSEESYFNERLDHLGILAGVCHEIGLANWLDTQDVGKRQQVSVGMATVAMDGAEWIRVQQSAVVFGTAVLC